MSDRPNILFVVDDLAFAQLLQPCLVRWGVNVNTSFNVATALRVLSERHVDLVIVAHAADSADSELISQLRRLRPQLPLVAICEELRGAGSQNVIDAGADAYLTKPIALSELKLAVERTLQITMPRPADAPQSQAWNETDAKNADPSGDGPPHADPLTAIPCPL